jgi:hypothetical protein
VEIIKIKHSGSFKKVERLLDKAPAIKYKIILDKYGQMGVNALASATPVDSGLTADSWDYKVSMNKGSSTITWINKNTKTGIPVAILLQYGHGTRNGGYVQGHDYINPALRHIFNQFADEAWKEITNL